MDLLWLIGFFSGVQLLCGSSSAHVSVLPIPKDSLGHGTQYRFQYFVRDERGDYKTQEEAGEGGNARGSYAVEEPDGDLRIVQYTADLGGGFKAHIKVDHGGKSPAKLEEIDIPAEEMRKLIEDNRNKTPRDVVEVDKSSKSYVLGPPRRMSDIIMEQAAAIREIISKEIEAEEKREAAERKRNEKPEVKEETIDVVDCDDKNPEKLDSPKTSSPETPQVPRNSSHENCGPCLNENENRTAKEKRPEESVEDLKNSQIFNKNSEPEFSKGAKKPAALKQDEQSPVVRVALSPRKIDELNTGDEKRDNNNRETHASSTSSGGPVRNFSFKNRIMFYKPAEKNLSRASTPGDFMDKKLNNDLKPEPTGDREEILLYSPYRDDDNQGDRKSRYITVPYEVLRPYLAEVEEDEN